MTTKIAVIGMGYVGIPAAALLADAAGFDVTGIQRRSTRSGWKIDVLNSGRCPFEGDEPGLDELVARVVEKGTFRVTDDYSILKDMDIILLDVQTPTEGPDHQPLYESLKEVSRQVGKYMKKGALVITESTVAPGTTEHIVKPILEKESGLRAGRDFSLAYSYERVMPGKLIEYIVNLPRIVGGIDKASEERAVAMYRRIVKKEIYSTDLLTAETSKTMENAYRDVNIAFANEMAMIAEKLGVDIFEIRELINSRSERHMHLPGAGVGGHCLPKDTWLLRYGLRKYWAPTMETEFVCLARKINDLMPLHMVELIIDALQKKNRQIEKARVAVLGVAYLEDSDDTRNTPAYRLIDELESRGAKVIAHDPHVREFPEAELTRDLDEALKNADCAVIMTRHKPYFSLDLKKVKSLMKTPILIDGRNVLDQESAKAAGFVCRGVGKGR
ncbi:MAG: nucleotide sugar dehydrogenase [PVC group bacterium]